jgi:hypothetical protein
MNKFLKEAILRQKIRQMHQYAVRSVLVERGEHNLYTTFVQPFTDVIDAAKLTGQDILNSLKLSFDFLTTINPKKMKKQMEEFDNRKKKINDKWKPLMERAESALNTGDFGIFALVMAPGALFTAQAAQTAYHGAANLHQYLSDSGWRIPFVAGLLDYTPEEPTKPAAGDKKKTTLLGRLSSLFFGETALHQGDLILEQEKEEELPKQKKEPDLKKAMEKYLKETGLDKKFEDDAKELLEAQKKFIDEIVNEAVPKLALITTLTQTADVDEFVGAIEQAEQEGLDLQSAGLDNVKTDVHDSAVKLAQSKEFRAQVSEEVGAKQVKEQKEKTKDASNVDESILETQIEEAAKKVAFSNAKQEFDKQMTTGKEQLRASALEALNEYTPSEISMNALKTTTIGLSLIKLIDDAKQKIQNA